MDVDHIVPLKHAYSNGGSSWSREEKKRFANDYDNLLAVDGERNHKNNGTGKKYKITCIQERLISCAPNRAIRVLCQSIPRTCSRVDQSEADHHGLFLSQGTLTWGLDYVKSPSSCRRAREKVSILKWASKQLLGGTSTQICQIRKNQRRHK